MSSACWNMATLGVSTKLGDRIRWVLCKVIWMNGAHPMANIRYDFHQTSGCIVAMNTIRNKVHLLGFLAVLSPISL